MKTTPLSFASARPGGSQARERKDFRLTPLLNLWLEEKQELPDNRGDHLHPSSVSLKPFCEREEALKRLIPSDLLTEPYAFRPEPELQRCFDVGHALHDWYQNRYFGPMGVLWGAWRCSRCQSVQKGFMPKDPCPCRGGGDPTRVLAPALFPRCVKTCSPGEDPNRLDPDRIRSRGGCLHCGRWGEWTFVEPHMPIETANIFGSCDGFIFLNGVWRVLELKTCSTNVFRRLEQEKPEHERQASIYSYASQFSRDCPVEDVRGVHYFYIQKDFPHGTKEWAKDRDEEYIVDLLRRVGTVDRAVAESDLSLTRRECASRKDIRAKNCPLEMVCFRHGMTAEKAKALRTIA